MSKQQEKSLSEKLERQMLQLAKARVNDAVKLAFLNQEDRNLIDGMDLSALSEFKRAGNGAVEVSFPNVRGIPEGMEEIARIIEDILPAHVSIVYVYWYVSWEQMEAQISTWQDIEDRGLTWAQLETLVTEE